MHKDALVRGGGGVRCGGGLRRAAVTTALGLALGAALGWLAGCGAASPSPRSPASAAGAPRTLSIVAAEDFWGSIVSQLAGRVGRVTSLVSDPNADPHDYEAGTADARALATADYVVVNGAGYDAWADKLVRGNPSSGRKVLDVARLLGAGPGANPHFWYDPDYVTRVADRVTADLEAADPSDAAYLGDRRAAFGRAVAPEQAQLDALRSRFAGTAAASTETMFVYLGDYLGLRIVSPAEFMKAVADGDDPPAPSVVAFDRALSSREAKVLVFNRQTSTAVTTNLRTLAARHGIPVVGLTETIEPAGATFEGWFTAELVALGRALDAGAGRR